MIIINDLKRKHEANHSEEGQMTALSKRFSHSLLSNYHWSLLSKLLSNSAFKDNDVSCNSKRLRLYDRNNDFFNCVILWFKNGGSRESIKHRMLLNVHK